MELVVRKSGSHVAYDRSNWLFAKQLEVCCPDAHVQGVGLRLSPVPGSGPRLVAVELTHHAQGLAGALGTSAPLR